MPSFIADIEMPIKWPSPPSRLSFSVFRSIEACPLRWGLTNAQYQADWCKNGKYPPKPSFAAICGSVVHRVIEILIRECAAKGERDLTAGIVDVLREFGGLSVLVKDTLDEILAGLDSNPRAVTLVRAFQQETVALPSNISARIQLTLNGLAMRSIPLRERSVPAPTHDQSKSTGALAKGLYSEIRLDSGQKWMGKVDLLLIDENEVRIEEIKSGKPKPEDKEQIKVYAWLWWSDMERNPNRVPASQLAIQYPDQTINIDAPSASDLNEFGASLQERGSKQLSAIERGVFAANPGRDTCCYCQVRQLCDRYWTELAPTERFDAHAVDLEASVISIVSPRTWKLRIAKGHPFESGEEILLKGDLPAGRDWTHSEVRIIDAFLVQPKQGHSGQSRLARMGSQSEIFVVR